MSIAEKVAGLIPSSTAKTSEPVEPADEGDDEEARDRAGLFECGDCQTTFISGTMDECPTCSGPVETIPTERDLGML